MTKRFFVISLIGIALLLGTAGAAPAVHAQGDNNGTTLINPLQGGGSLESFLASIIVFVIRMGTIVLILMIVFVGYKFVMAKGEPGEITKAREMLKWTLIGGLVLLGAQGISMGIQATVKALVGGG
ncbi:MAG: hypothetical protein WAW90_01560 [Minisyncoccia bacterium]